MVDRLSAVRPLKPRLAAIGWALAVAHGAAGCGQDSVAGYAVWVDGEPPGGLVVSVSTPDGAPGGPITAFYVVPVGELRRSTVTLPLGYTDATDHGAVRVFDARCRLLDQTTVGPGDLRVDISAGGVINVTRYSELGTPPDVPPLEPAPTSCPVVPARVP